MDTPFFIARRLGHDKKGKSFTGLIKVIAILSIVIGIAVMIISVAVVTGFQNEIRNKVIGFGSHFQISNYDDNLTAATTPIDKNQDFLPILRELQGVRHLQVFATKAGILKTEDEIHGVVIKGVGNDFDWSFFRQQLKEGHIPNLSDSIRSDEILVSVHIAKRLMLHPGDRVNMYFIQEPPRIRRFEIAGIYETGIEELDKIFILGDIRHVQRLNDWDEDEVGGIEILVDDYRDIPKLSQSVFDIIPYSLNARNIKQLYPQIFDWLALLDMNVYVILILMVLVAGINMITTLLIAVLEKTNLIGILKSLGAANYFIRKVFLYNAAFLIGKGLLIGNLTGILFCLIQDRYGLIRLPQESYYVSVVPVNLEWMHLLLLNAGTFLVCMIMLIFPSYIISRITPVKAMLFR